MLRGIYSSVSSMINLQERQSIITNNLANIGTTGYKEESLISKSFDDVILSNHDNYKNGKAHKQTLGSVSFGVRIDDTITNHKQGVHTPTNKNTDFALDGKGFFTVQDFNGKDFYTRDGSFKVNSQGYLVTNAGYYVMGNNKLTGNNEPIYVGNSKLLADANNQIYIDDVKKYSFNIVDFSDYNKINKSGDNLYSGNNPTKVNTTRINQGFVEASNVDPINTTALLMETVKEFEANQKIIQTMDSTLNKIANEIGTVR